MKHGGCVVKVHRTRLRGVKTASAAPIPAKSARIAQGDSGFVYSSGPKIGEGRIIAEQTSKITNKVSEPLQESRIGKILGTKTNSALITMDDDFHEAKLA